MIVAVGRTLINNHIIIYNLLFTYH